VLQSVVEGRLVVVTTPFSLASVGVSPDIATAMKPATVQHNHHVISFISIIIIASAQHQQLLYKLLPHLSQHISGFL